MRCFLWLSLTAFFGVLSGELGRSQSISAAKSFYPECPRFAVDYRFDCYHNFAEVERFLQDAVEAYPQFARLESIGKSFQGRDLWVATVTDFEAGSPEDKPAIWVDGGIDSDEVISTEAALGLLHRLVTSTDERIAELRRNRTFYIAPNVIPDGSELHHSTPERPRDSTLKPWDDDNDGLLDEDPPEDLDGDGQALQMRREDPTGAMTPDEADPRLLRRRRPGDSGPFYQLYLEGVDNDEDGKYQEDRPGGIDPNRNYPGNWSVNQRGSGPFAGSEAELRAMLEFISARPNIAASQHFHSSGGVVLRPPSVPDFDLPEEDLELYLAVSRHGLEVTGYNLATSVYDWNWPRGSANAKRGQVWRDREGALKGYPVGSNSYPAFGGSIDGLYSLFGVLAFANEIYQMGEDLDGDGRVSSAEQLKYNDEKMDGAAFKEWAPFEHPQLGPVEIGGWRKFGHNNPVGERIDEEVQRNVDFVLMQAELAPLLQIRKVDLEDLGGGVRRVTATVHNSGEQPTELAIRKQQNRAVPVRARLEPDEGVGILSKNAQEELGIIAGHQEAEVSWLIRGAGKITIRVRHPKAGTAVEVVEIP